MKIRIRLHDFLAPFWKRDHPNNDNNARSVRKWIIKNIPQLFYNNSLFIRTYLYGIYMGFCNIVCGFNWKSKINEGHFRDSLWLTSNAISFLIIIHLNKYETKVSEDLLFLNVQISRPVIEQIQWSFRLWWNFIWFKVINKLNIVIVNKYFGYNSGFFGTAKTFSLLKVS